MRKLPLVLVLVTMAATAATIKDLTLVPGKLPAGCQAADGKYPVDIQTAMLYDDYQIYKSLMPDLADKGYQSFECDHDKATLFFFHYKSPEDRAKAEKGIRPLLWGEPNPSREHPELIKSYDNVLVVISTRKSGEKLAKALDDRASESLKK